MSDQVTAWLGTLPPKAADRITNAVDHLAQEGPSTGPPLVKSIRGARAHNMKELRSGSMRILFAFDAQERAVLLFGGDKAGAWNRWYPPAIRQADRSLDAHRRDSGEVTQWQTRVHTAGPRSGARSR